MLHRVRGGVWTESKLKWRWPQANLGNPGSAVRRPAALDGGDAFREAELGTNQSEITKSTTQPDQNPLSLPSNRSGKIVALVLVTGIQLGSAW